MEVLEALMRTTRAAWPRMRRWAEPVLRGLLRLLVDVSSDAGLTAAARQRLLERGAAGLRLLDACWPGRVRLLLLQVDHSCCSPQVARCLATV
ncbi:TELO2-interacting protein 2-like isoform 2-T3 [Menidia menidia]